MHVILKTFSRALLYFLLLHSGELRLMAKFAEYQELIESKLTLRVWASEKREGDFDDEFTST